MRRKEKISFLEHEDYSQKTFLLPLGGVSGGSFSSPFQGGLEGGFLLPHFIGSM